MGSRPRATRAVGSSIATVLATILLAAAPIADALPAGDASAGAPTTRPLALVYRGPAACGGCAQAVAALIRRSPLHFDVAYVGPGQARPLTAAGLNGAALYAQPGGNDSVGSAMRALGPTATRAIKAWVAAGGHYVGFCMGAYLAGSGPGMGLLAPGNTGEYDRTPGASVHSAAEAVIPITWDGRPQLAYAQDPPFIVPSHVPGEQILSRFANGRVNALVRPYGHGAVGVVGTHPEANRSWFTRRLWREIGGHVDSGDGLELIADTMQA